MLSDIAVKKYYRHPHGACIITIGTSIWVLPYKHSPKILGAFLFSL